MAASTATLTEGPVAATLAKMASAMLVGLLAAAGFNLIDTYFVAQLGTRQLAAMSFTFPVAMLVGGLAMGIGVGASAVIAKAIGQGQHDEVRRLTVDSLLLAVVVVGAVVMLGLATIGPLFTLLGATAETLPFVKQYMRIWYIGVVFVVVPMVGNHAIRATGDTLSPSIIMVVDLGLNAVLDPPLIFGFGPIPAMGISGAALATVICRAIALVASLYVLGRRKGMLTRERPSRRQIWTSWKRVLHVGLPAAASHMLMPLSTGVVLKMVAWFGTAAVAAFGAAGRLEMLAVLPLIALGVSMVPFVGQNRGAGRYERIHRGHAIGWRFDVVWGLGCTVALAVFRGPISRIFTDDPAVVRALALMLCVAPLAYGFKGLSHLAASGMNAIEKPYHAWVMMVLRLIVLTLPMAAVGALLGGFAGLVAGMVAAEIVAGLVATRWVAALYRRSEGSMRPQTTDAAQEIARAG